MTADLLGVESELIRPILDAFVKVIRQSVIEGASVAIPNVGTIQTYVGKPTRTKDPQTNKVRKVPARRRVRFVAAKTLSVEVRGPEAPPSRVRKRRRS